MHSLLTLTTVIFISFFLLFLQDTKNRQFLYAATPFLFSSISLLGCIQVNTGINPLFWTRIMYVGIFGYMHSFMPFVSAITGKKINRIAHTTLTAIMLFFWIFTLFTDRVFAKPLYQFGYFMRPTSGPLYTFFMIVFFAVSFYFFISLTITPRSELYKNMNYRPVYIGLAFALIAGFYDFMSVAHGRPILPYFSHAFVLGTVVFSLSFLWSYLSQYSWILSALTRYENQISELIAKSNKNFIELIQLIAKTIETKDQYTAGHSLRVMDYATKIAQTLSMNEREIELLKHACLLHDIGKIGIPENILNKKTPLTAKERTFIQSHPVLARQILSTVSDFQDILEIIYSHHERVDGNGYPGGLKHDEIPLLARIIAVADTYDAMLSERPYRRAKSKKQAINELKNVKNTQLDGALVDKFLELLID